jgi:hypothetical protein
MRDRIVEFSLRLQHVAQVAVPIGAIRHERKALAMSAAPSSLLPCWCASTPAYCSASGVSGAVSKIAP